MRLLLDTNVLILALEGQLTSHLRGAAVTSENDLYVSVASLWEMAIKARIGKLRLTVPLRQLPDVIAEMHFTLLTIQAPHVLAAVDPEPATRDPFDRLLLAQCSMEGLQLVTLDRVLAAHPLSWKSA
jgi:PIN domain nuclease of toxin-antitoxin system